MFPFSKARVIYDYHYACVKRDFVIAFRYLTTCAVPVFDGVSQMALDYVLEIRPTEDAEPVAALRHL